MNNLLYYFCESTEGGMTAVLVDRYEMCDILEHDRYATPGEAHDFRRWSEFVGPGLVMQVERGLIFSVLPSVTGDRW